MFEFCRLEMGKQKLDEIFGDLCYEVDTATTWDKIKDDIDSLLRCQRGLKYLALNKTFVIPGASKETPNEDFPPPVIIPRSEEETVRVLNRLTLDLRHYGSNLDTLMHTLTRNFLPERFDLIAVRPYSYDQLDAFLSTHNITVDIICMDRTVKMLDNLRSDVFKRMKAQKFYMEQHYSPYLLSETAEERVKMLRVSNYFVPHSIRHCRKFLLSSGANDVKQLKTFYDLEGTALALGFPPKLYRKVVQEHVVDCILESDSKRSAFKNTTVFHLSDKLLQKWTYNHETRRRIENFRKTNSQNFASEKNIFCGSKEETVGDETGQKDYSEVETMNISFGETDDATTLEKSQQVGKDALKVQQKLKKKKRYIQDCNSAISKHIPAEQLEANLEDSTPVEDVPKKKRKKMQEMTE